MKPEPRASRTPPPTRPPAPPGAAPRPGKGKGRGDANRLYDLLAKGLSDLDSIRKTLKAHNIFPDDAELEAAIPGIVDEARLALRTHLDAIVKAEPFQNLEHRRLEIQNRLTQLLADLESDTYCRDRETFDSRINNPYVELLFSVKD